MALPATVVCAVAVRDAVSNLKFDLVELVAGLLKQVNHALLGAFSLLFLDQNLVREFALDVSEHSQHLFFLLLSKRLFLSKSLLHDCELV